MDPVTILIIGVILVAAWFLARAALKLTAALFRIGCFIIVLLIIGALVLTYMG